MIYTTTFTVIICGLLCPSQISGAEIYQKKIDQTALAATCSAETASRVFGSILYINLISYHDPQVVFESSLPSEQGAQLYYQEKLRIFLEKGFSNAEELALSSASAILLADEFTIDYFYFTAANAIGDFLVDTGFLNCYNVIQRAIQFFEIEQKLFKSLGSDGFETYVEAILSGVYEVLLEDLGYTAEDNQDVFSYASNLFYPEYSKYLSHVSEE